MSKRSYNQYCAMARALDTLGERWTLLVIRELLSGPKRFKDLLEGLPGIGTNLLAARLKNLEGEGLLCRVTLPPPAGSTVYELTERGREIEPVLTGLVRWGLRLLDAPRPGDVFRPVWALQAMKATFRSEAARGVWETYEFRVGEDVFHIQVEDGSPEPRCGAAWRPGLIVTTDADTFLALVSGQLGLEEAAESERVETQGNPDALVRCREIFGLWARERSTERSTSP
jgi:DNA-binding HxlR family transcriptional regulator